MSRILRVALLAPLKRPITPDTTVSRNRIVADIAVGLAKKGHQVSVFGTADSNLPFVKFIGVIPKGLNFLEAAENPFYQETAYMTHSVREVVKRQGDFDIIHNHMYPEFIPLLARDSFQIPVITTVHAQISQELKMALTDTRGESLLACISENSKRLLNLPAEVVYNGIDTNFYTPIENREKSYFLFVGRMSKAKDKNGRFLDPKGVQNAISAAEKTSIVLKIVGSVENKAFYDELIAPHLSELIQFVQEPSKEQTMTREQMRELFQNALGLLFPIEWEEPFGLVMIEAMACGTPVIAYSRGSVSEIVRDGLTGFVIHPENATSSGSWFIKEKGINGLVGAIRRVKQIDRTACRNHAVDNFSNEAMVNRYEALYFDLLSNIK